MAEFRMIVAVFVASLSVCASVWALNAPPEHVEDDQRGGVSINAPHGNAASAANGTAIPTVLSSTEAVDRSATAFGGDGAAAQPASGNGGAATATTNIQNSGAAAVHTLAGATGGAGAAADGSGTAGAGGSAHATSTAKTIINHFADAEAAATGGNSGNFSDVVPVGATGNIGGDATAIGHAFGIAAVRSTSTATAGFGTYGSANGSSHATATASSTTSVMGVFADSKIVGGTNALPSHASKSFAQATIGTALTGVADTFSNVAMASMNPSPSAIAPVFSSGDNTSLAAAFGSADNIVAHGALSVFAPVDGSPLSYSTVTLTLAPGQIAGSLVVGFYDATGFSSLPASPFTLSLAVNGTTVDTQAPLDGVPILFPMIAVSALDAPIEVTLTLALADGAYDDGFAGQFVVGGSELAAMPEPTTGAAIGLLGIAGLLSRRRRTGQVDLSPMDDAISNPHPQSRQIRQAGYPRRRKPPTDCAHGRQVL